jgi:hypothetical protein
MIPALARWNGDHAMTNDTTKEAAIAAEVLLFDNWFDEWALAKIGRPLRSTSDSWT